jgi:TRAP transporter TAXI family solute receptor
VGKIKRIFKAFSVIAVVLTIAASERVSFGAEQVDIKSLKLTQDLVYATNPISTGNYAISAAQAAEITNRLGINIVVQPTSGPEGIVIGMKEGVAQLGLVSTGLVQDPWEDEEDSFKHVRVLMVGDGLRFGFVTREDLGIKTIPDLKGKRVTYGGLSLSHFRAAEGILRAYDLDPAKDVTTLDMAFSTAGFVDLAEGRTDATIGSIAGSKMDELASKCKPYVIPIDVEHAKKASEITGGLLVPGPIQNEVPGAPLGTPMVAMLNSIIVTENVDDDTVYAITRILIEGQKQLGEVASDLKFWLPEGNATTDALYPYHPGAIRYYKEAGLWNDELEAWNKGVLDKYGLKR